MAEEQKENQAQNGTQETRLPLSIDRSKEISKYMNVFNASFAYNEVFLEMGLGRVLDEAGKQVYSVRMNEVVSMTPQTLKALAMVLGRVCPNYEAQYGPIGNGIPKDKVQ